MGRKIDLALRVFGIVTALSCFLLGGLYLVVFFFVGHAAGFTDHQYTLMYSLMASYVIGLFGLSIWLSLRPSVLRGALLLGLITPFLILSVFCCQ